jgi:hypothetical protein
MAACSTRTSTSAGIGGVLSLNVRSQSAPPDSVLLKARTLIATGRDVPVALRVLAGEFRLHARTLRAAAQDGRLAATFGTRPYLGKIAAMSTRAAATQFMAAWYRQTYGRGRRPRVPVCRVVVPVNYGPFWLDCGPSRLESTGTRRTNRGGWQGRRLSMGKRQASALARVLDEDRPPAAQNDVPNGANRDAVIIATSVRLGETRTKAPESVPTSAELAARHRRQM